MVCYQNRIQWDYQTGEPLWAADQFPNFRFMDPARTEMRPRPTLEPPPVVPVPHAPPPVPDPAPDPSNPHVPGGVTFVWNDLVYFAAEGDFNALERIFRPMLVDPGHRERYRKGDQSWQWVVDRTLDRAR